MTFIIEIALKMAAAYHWVPSWKTDYLARTRYDTFSIWNSWNHKGYFIIRIISSNFHTKYFCIPSPQHTYITIINHVFILSWIQVLRMGLWRFSAINLPQSFGAMFGFYLVVWLGLICFMEKIELNENKEKWNY